MKYHPFNRSFSGSLLFVILALLLFSSIVFAGCGTKQPASETMEQGQVYVGMDLMVQIMFKPLPTKMPGGEGDTPATVQLGRELFFEKDLSLNRSQSCNSCHRLDNKYPGGDMGSFSEGAAGGLGERNSPTVLNAGFQSVQFWDGRAADLVQQATMPMLNPIEMGMTGEGLVVERLKGSAKYRAAFKAAFPNETDPVTFKNTAIAIAAFERTLVARSRFDRYLEGDMTALTKAELKGLTRFLDTGCSECHNGHPVGGLIMRRAGYFHPYINQSDTGRYKVTGDESDMYVFKVPMLRNVTLTPPYFHDGGLATLSDAVHDMAWMQLDTQLSKDEIEEIVTFLHSLENSGLVELK